MLIDHTNGRVLDVLESREKEVVLRWLAAGKQSGCLSAVEEVTCDMWDAYVEASKEVFGPAVRVTIDRFHVMKNFQDRLNEARSLHSQIGIKSGHAYANMVMRVLSAILSFGVGQERIEKNPVGVLKWFPVKARRTVIPDTKLPDWFKAVNDLRYDKESKLAGVGADYLEFVLLTGLRRNEAARLTWADVNLDEKTVTVTDTKNSNPLVLPLSEYLNSLLARRKNECGSSKWVFPSPGPKGKEFLAEPRYAVNLVSAKCGVTHSIHDLRRTFISKAVRFVPYAVLKTIVNHSAERKGDVTLDHYVRLDVEDLRPHMKAITEFFLSLKAKGQGMQIAQAQ